MAQELEARLMVVVSHSGATALALSKRRNLVPIIGISDRPETQRQMCLYWNVIPLTKAPMTDSHELLRYMENWGQADGCLSAGDLIVWWPASDWPRGVITWFASMKSAEECRESGERKAVSGTVSARCLCSCPPLSAFGFPLCAAPCFAPARQGQ